MSNRSELRNRTKSELIHFAKLYYVQVQALTAAIAAAGFAIRASGDKLELVRPEVEAEKEE